MLVLNAVVIRRIDLALFYTLKKVLISYLKYERIILSNYIVVYCLLYAQKVCI